MKNKELIGAALLAAGVYFYTQNQRPPLAPKYATVPAPPQPNTPQYLQWVSLVVSQFGKVADLWKPGGPFYKEPIPKYDAGSIFWQDVEGLAGIGKVYKFGEKGAPKGAVFCNDRHRTYPYGRGVCSHHKGVDYTREQSRAAQRVYAKRKQRVKELPTGTRWINTPELSPNKSIKANITRAVNDVLTLKKYSAIPSKVAAMIYTDFKGDTGAVVVAEEGTLRASIYKSFSDNQKVFKNPILVESDYFKEQYWLTPLGIDLVKAVSARLESLRQAKSGSTLFPGEISGIGKSYDHGTPDIRPQSRVDQYWQKNRRKIVQEVISTGVDFEAGSDYYNPIWVKEKFHLHSIEFGNWMNQADRKAFLYATAVTMRDIAKVLRQPMGNIGMKKYLALAFGSRGNGGRAAAFYIPLPYHLINLTKHAGKGTFVHEWGHAVDFWLGKASGGRSLRRQPQTAPTDSVPYLFEKAIEAVLWNKDGSPSAYQRWLDAQGSRVSYYGQRTEIWARMCERYFHWKFQTHKIKNTWGVDLVLRPDIPSLELVKRAAPYMARIFKHLSHK